MRTIPLLLVSSVGWTADTDPFEPAGSMVVGTGGPQTEAGHVRGDGLVVGLSGGVARDLLVINYLDGTHEPGVSMVVPMHVTGAWTFDRRARIEVLVPFYPHIDSPMNDFNGAAFGDVRIQSHIALVDLGGAFGLSVVPRLGLPTATPVDASINRGISFGTILAAGGELDLGLGYAANLGLTFAPSNSVLNIDISSTFDTLFSTWWRFSDAFRVGAEIQGSFGFLSSNQSPNELATGHLFAQSALDSGLALTVGAGSGLWSGVGAPSYRVFAGISYAIPRRIRDVAHQDSAELQEDCTHPHQDMDGCPDEHLDGGNIADTEADCSDHAGEPAHSGCDGGTPVQAPTPDCDAEPASCTDTDGDAVPDYRDQCPHLPKPSAEDLSLSDGCPKTVFITATHIKVMETIAFSPGKAEVNNASLAVLETIAAVAATHTRTHIEIGCHTDAIGDVDANLRLSQTRADAVLDILVAHGVPPYRLVAIGYGAQDPIDTNRTEAGRAANRRVEFRFIDSPVAPSHGN